MTTTTALCIGDELLDGRIADTNGPWLARRLANRGAALEEVRIVGDDIGQIVDALEQLSRPADLIVVTGGLGPTADDLTHQAAARWVDAELELDVDVRDRLKHRFDQRGYAFTPNNMRQCTFPAGARILATEVGTAAGFEVIKDDCRAVFLPGVPSEFRWFVDTYIIDDVGSNDHRHRRRLAFFGAGESQLESALDGIQPLAADRDARIGYRADYPINEVHIKADRPADLVALEQFVVDRVGRWLIEVDDQTLSERIGEALAERQATVTTAESCTGGRISAMLTRTPGASGWFERGAVVYANWAKVDMLGVQADILEGFGAVSPQTVCQMASGARMAAQSTYAIAVSGIAGPSGGTDQKPAGTVHLAVAAADGVWHRQVDFPGRSRQAVLSASVYAAASLLLWRLENRLDDHQVNGPFPDDDVWGPDGIPISGPTD